MALAEKDLNLEALLKDLQENNANLLNRFRTVVRPRVFTGSSQSSAPAEPITVDEDPVAIPTIVIESSTPDILRGRRRLHCRRYKEAEALGLQI
ncbi:jg15479 [Pararge aegeria aegeria]|uniref:Jg15479 protein n=1 Tax=Pararge aegeria aegeria TaxID=348720 RepID=A0A8S4QK91_9NEOP|nr:jg15479 [Pararge aegeria aegeria]